MMRQLAGPGLVLALMFAPTGLAAQPRQAPPVIRTLPPPPSLPPPIQIYRRSGEPRQPDVDIQGVSSLEFEPDQEWMAILGEVPASTVQHVDLYVGTDGNPLRCEPVADDVPYDLADVFCGNLLRSARVRIDDWYSLAGQQGRLGLRLLSRPGPTHRFAVAQGARPSSNAAEFELGVLTDGVFSSNRCFPRSLSDSIRIADGDNAQLCAGFAGDSSVWGTRCRAVTGQSETVSRLVCRLDIETIANPVPWVYEALTAIDGLKRTPRYVAQLASEFPMLAPAEGTLSPRSTARIDYPSRALRMGLQGRVSALLGVSGDGRARSCRPVETSGSHELDYMTCKQLVRYARFDLAESVGGFAGVKYYRAAINWVLPE